MHPDRLRRHSAARLPVGRAGTSTAARAGALHSLIAGSVTLRLAGWRAGPCQRHSVLLARHQAVAWGLTGRADRAGATRGITAVSNPSSPCAWPAAGRRLGHGPGRASPVSTLWLLCRCKVLTQILFGTARTGRVGPGSVGTPPGPTLHRPRFASVRFSCGPRQFLCPRVASACQCQFILPPLQRGIV